MSPRRDAQLERLRREAANVAIVLTSDGWLLVPVVESMPAESRRTNG